MKLMRIADLVAIDYTSKPNLTTPPGCLGSAPMLRGQRAK